MSTTNSTPSPVTLYPRAVSAIFKREVAASFFNPKAYVFITLFVFLSGIAAFWSDAFFIRNLANLDQLNIWIPILLAFLVPAITMGALAEERQQGTDELLLTLPSTEGQIALGKYLGCVAIFGISLLFAACHIIVLFALGRPDVGLLISTYLGYFLAGSLLISFALCASALTANATIAFIAGSAVCGVLIGMRNFDAVSAASWTRTLAELSVPARLESFSRGVLNFADIFYFVGGSLIGVITAAGILRARRTIGLHRPIVKLLSIAQLLCALIIVGSLTIFLDRLSLRSDTTAERLWTLSPTTRAVVTTLPPETSVTLTAFVSRDVPGSLVQQKEQLLGLVREIEAASRGRIQTSVRFLEPDTLEARDINRTFGISPASIEDDRPGMTGAVRVFLGAAAQSSTGEISVIPFLSRGLPAEYELARAIRAVASTTRKTVGILDTPVGLFGQFNFQSMSSSPDWPIITELRKQYNVRRIDPNNTYPSMDVLLVAQPGVLNAEQLARLVEYVGAGKPALIFEDPMPLIGPQLATAEPTLPGGNPMTGGGPPKPGLTTLWETLGAKINPDFVAWDSFNPRPVLAEAPGEFLWVTPRRNIGFDPFSQQSPIVSGLQELLMIFAGRIESLSPADAKATADAGITPLITSGPTSGVVAYNTLISRNMFGSPSINPNRRPTAIGTQMTMAAMIKGSTEKPRKVMLVGDLDMISPTFWQLREQGTGDFELDNVPFVLNAVDTLAGDESLVELRKKRRIYRTLEVIDNRRLAEQDITSKAQEAARLEAETRLQEARDRLDKEVKAVQDRTDLDTAAKGIMLESVRAAEQRRLDALTSSIETQRNRKIEDARLESAAKIQEIQHGVKLAAVTLPPVPAIITGLIVLISRRRRAEALRKDL